MKIFHITRKATPSRPGGELGDRRQPYVLASSAERALRMRHVCAETHVATECPGATGGYLRPFEPGCNHPKVPEWYEWFPA